MIVDLHSHSHCSDGSLSPSELVALAAQNKVDMLALTDHDTCKGLAEAHVAAQQHGIRLINGVEITATHAMMSSYSKNNRLVAQIVHVVGLNMQQPAWLQQRLSELQHARETRGQAICAKLASLFDDGFHDNPTADRLWQTALAYANHQPKSVGRAHIARALCELGKVKSVQQAFDRYLADNKPAYVALPALSLSEAISAIQQAGGVAVLAHPTRYKLSATKVRQLITDFAKLGGNAVELPPLNESPSTRAMIDRCIAQHGLSVSVGSDYHGSYMPWVKLGTVPKLKAQQVGVWQEF